MATPRLFLIDGSGYFYRAFYAVKNLSRKDGFPTNAVFGFVKMLKRVVEEYEPEYLAMVFDAKGPTFRHEMDKNYKAQRKPMPDDLRAQLPYIKSVVEAFNIPAFEMQGFEADDIIGTLAKQAEEKGLEAVIVSGDKDMMQLVTEKTTVLDTMKERTVGAAEVMDFWGVPAPRVVDVMGLTGDASDNIPGAPGIGIKTAAKLIQEFGSLDALLDQAETVKQPKRRQTLIEFADQIRLSRKLATIETAVPVEGEIADLKAATPDRKALYALFKELEFNTLSREYADGAAEETEADEPVAEPVAINYRTLTEEADFEAFLKELKQQKSFSFDLETTGVDPIQAEVVGLSFSWKAGEAVYLPVAHTWDAVPEGQLDRKPVLAALKPLLEGPALEKTGQNLKYEYAVLKKYGITVRGIARDSMLYSYLIHGPGRRHNLDAIAADELGRTTITYKEVAGTGKKQLRFDQVPIEKAGPYACEDAEVAWQAADSFAPQLKKIAPVQKLYDEVELPLLTVLAEMELAGALVDRPALEKMSADLSGRREELVKTIHDLAGEPFNVNSTQQLGNILFNKLGIKGGKKTKTGFSTDVSVLTKLAEKGEPIPEKVLEYRSLTKLQSTYTDALTALINPITKRVHTSFNQAVTLTGRLSSSDPNLQNIPIRTEDGKRIRTAFIAPPGSVLLSADYSQIELRLLAHVGKVEPLQEAFHAGRDIHSATAAEIFNVALDSVDGEQRRMAKTINFGLIYGMSQYGLAKRLGIDNFTAKEYMDLYFARYTGVKRYMDDAMNQARDAGYAETLLKRRCPLPEINSKNRTLREMAERAAINAPLQGSAADLIKVAMLRLHEALIAKKLASRMILQVHDELILEVPVDELDTVRQIVREAMEGVAELSVPLKVDMGTGANWAEAH